MKRFLFFFILFFQLSAALCQSTTETQPLKTGKITIREFDQERLNTMRNDQDFNYLDARPESRSSILRWLYYQLIRGLAAIFGNAVVAEIFVIVVLVVLGIALLFGIYHFFIAGKINPVAGGSGSKLPYEVQQEDIHSIDFKKEIEEALLRKEFKKAVRYIYLLSLKILSDKNLIEWTPFKTNYEYLSELSNPSVRDAFGDLSYYFNYIWYGDFGVDKELYDVIYNSYNQLNRNVKEEVES